MKHRAFCTVGEVRVMLNSTLVPIKIAHHMVDLQHEMLENAVKAVLAIGWSTSDLLIQHYRRGDNEDATLCVQRRPVFRCRTIWPPLSDPNPKVRVLGEWLEWPAR